MGDSIIDGSLTVTGTQNINNDVTMNNNLLVIGNITANSITVIDTDDDDVNISYNISLDSFIQNKINNVVQPLQQQIADLLTRIVTLENQ